MWWWWRWWPRCVSTLDSLTLVDLMLLVDLLLFVLFVLFWDACDASSAAPLSPAPPFVLAAATSTTVVVTSLLSSLSLSLSLPPFLPKSPMVLSLCSTSACTSTARSVQFDLGVWSVECGYGPTDSITARRCTARSARDLHTRLAVRLVREEGRSAALSPGSSCALGSRTGQANGAMGHALFAVQLVLVWTMKPCRFSVEREKPPRDGLELPEARGDFNGPPGAA